MSLISKLTEELKRVFPNDINAAEDIPAEIKVLVGEIEKEFNLINQRLSLLEQKRPAPVVTAPPAA